MFEAVGVSKLTLYLSDHVGMGTIPGAKTMEPIAPILFLFGEFNFLAGYSIFARFAGAVVNQRSKDQQNKTSAGGSTGISIL